MLLNNMRLGLKCKIDLDFSALGTRLYSLKTQKLQWFLCMCWISVLNFKCKGDRTKERPLNLQVFVNEIKLDQFKIYIEYLLHVCMLNPGSWRWVALPRSPGVLLQTLKSKEFECCLFHFPTRWSWASYLTFLNSIIQFSNVTSSYHPIRLAELILLPCPERVAYFPTSSGDQEDW